MPDFYISAVKYNQTHTHIEKVRTHKVIINNQGKNILIRQEAKTQGSLLLNLFYPIRCLLKRLLKNLTSIPKIRMYASLETT